MIEKFKNLVDTLKNSLPTEAPLLISKAIDPSRALILREACLHRICELAESAYEDFAKDRLVAAFIMARAIMETESLFWAFLDEIEQSLKNKNIDEIRAFLSKALAGVKATQAKEMGRELDPLHVLKLVRDKMGKKITHYYNQYEALSEFSHPNAAGLNETYARIDWDQQKVFFGINKERVHANLALPPLVGSIEAFLYKYDESAKLLEEFVNLCEVLLENQPSQEPIKDQV